MKDNILKIASFTLLVVGGAVCVMVPGSIEGALPYIAGIILILIGIIGVARGVIHKEDGSIEMVKFTRAMVSIIMGVCILMNRYDAINLIAIVWGIKGLYSGTEGLAIAINNKKKKERFLAEMIQSIIEIVFSIALVFDPFEKIEEHIMLVGLNMIIDATRRLFKDEEFSEE